MPLARHDDINTNCCVDATEFLLTCLLRGMTGAGESYAFADTFLLTCLLRGMTKINRRCVIS